ncbi:hypothetical protein FQA39_LY11829 [Lamprigera yunnana]|nr:hypothetical protein FQA39_LY11829 [Lamprigera yunnana]
MPTSAYYWNSPDFDCDESVSDTLPRSSYIDPWDLENYAYIKNHLDSLEMNSDTSSFGEPIEASLFYHNPLKQEPTLKDKMDSFVDSEYTKYAEIEEIYVEDADQKLENTFTSPSLTFTTDVKVEDKFNLSALDDHKPQPKILLNRRMSYSFGEHQKNFKCTPPIMHSIFEDKEALLSEQLDNCFQPKNFGLSSYGHLQIDYSCSWDTLHRYISN